MSTYEHFGVMLDVSRNAVMTVKALKKMIDCLEKMGYDTLELYAEDTYQLQGEPYFGYQRGGYSSAELKEIDAYAKEHGVELIPCVQTLAHFTNLVTLPQYASMVDADDILLIDDERTYALIEKIFANAAENFTSRKINIGMDEAHMVGLGRYLDKHGYCNRFELLNRHLSRVCDIAEKYGFTPHIWSDMYFRLANHGDYYGKDVHVSDEVRAKVDERIELAYWDYYNVDSEMYDAMITSHQEFNRPLWFAGGAWSWYGFAPLNYHSLNTMRPALESVRKHGVKHVFITMWGDNGKECSFFALLPSLYAIRQYADGNFDEESIRAGFKKIFGVSYDDFMLLDTPNFTKSVVENQTLENASKVFLYSDCFLGIFDDYMEREGSIPYAKYAADLFAAEKRAGEFGYIFHALGELCNVLEMKASLGVETRKAYRSKNKEELRAVVARYEALLPRLEAFYEGYKNLWFTENKGFGWEIQDARLGGLQQRVRSCKQRLQAYIDGEIEGIEELDMDILPFRKDASSYRYDEIFSRSKI